MDIKKIILLFLAIGTLAFQNCDNIPKDKIVSSTAGHYKKTKYFENGKILSEEELIKTDTGFTGDGYYKRYYENGNLKTLEFNKKGKLDSIYLSYDSQGHIMQKLHFFNDSLYGSQFRYYDNGKIKDYTFYVNPDKYSFSIDYTASGKIDTIEGHPDFLKLKKIKHTFSRNDTVEIYNWLASPENVKISLTTKLINSKTTLVEKRNDFEYLQFIDMHYLIFNYACNGGSAEYIAITNLYDVNTDALIYKDTVTYKISVE